MDEPGLAFTFVTHGIDSALVQTKAAGDKDVGIGGGASVIWQYLGARSSMSSGYIFLQVLLVRASDCSTILATR